MQTISTVSLSRLDTLLLRAALLEGEAARAAYAELNESFDLDAIDYGRQRLLPLLHANLTGLGIADPRLGRLRGIRHYHWAKNQVRIRNVAPVLAALRAAGLRIALLKGAALIATGLSDMSLRPMDDIDILVPPESRDAAIAILAAHGFQPKETAAWYVRGEAASRFAGWQFADAAGFEIDLHWFLLHLDRRPGADDGIWRRAVRATFAGQEIMVLGSADHVFHTLAHAAAWSEASLLRWAADVAMIMRRVGPTMDWQPLIAEARRRRLASPLHDALAALRTGLGLAIPESVIAGLRGAAGRFERLEHRLRATPPQMLAPRDRSLSRMMDFRRTRGDLMARPLAAVVPAYLRRRATLPRSPTLPVRFFCALGRPRWLRRLTSPDARLTLSSSESLPALGQLDASYRSPDGAGFLDGWSHPEGEGRWSIAPEARVGWRLPAGAVPALELELEAAPFWPPQGPVPHIEVWANDRLAGSWRGSGDGKMRLRLAVPPEALRGQDRLIATISNTRSRSPADTARAVDARPLHVFLTRITVRPVSA